MLHNDDRIPHRSSRPLLGARVLVCGKGGSGKSTVVALMAGALERKGYPVLVLDGDASNPEGLVRLLFGVGVDQEPKPLIEFFGGIDRVTCPVDDPSPLTRLDDPEPVPTSPIRLAEEIGPEYRLARRELQLLQVGKIRTYGQGCDGPLEKVVRDFVVEDALVSLIDEKAGVEHFGRRIPDHVDIVLAVLDCTRESISIAHRIAGFADEMPSQELRLVLNKVPSVAMAAEMMTLLGDLGSKVVGTIPHIPELVESGLRGRAIDPDLVSGPVDAIVERLEAARTEVG